MLYRVGGAEEWSARLSDVARVTAALYVRVLVTDLRIMLKGATVEALKVERSRESEAKADAALQWLRP